MSRKTACPVGIISFSSARAFTGRWEERKQQSYFQSCVGPVPRVYCHRVARFCISQKGRAVFGRARMAESVDAVDSKSTALTGVRVRLSLRAPGNSNKLRSFCLPKLIPKNDHGVTFKGIPRGNLFSGLHKSEYSWARMVVCNPMCPKTEKILFALEVHSCRTQPVSKCVFQLVYLN